MEITDIQSAYCAQTIAEFEHGSAMTALEALPLPYPRPCHVDPEVFIVFRVLQACTAQPVAIQQLKPTCLS